MHVPFENIDLHTDQPIRLEVPALFDKLIDRRRLVKAPEIRCEVELLDGPA